MWGPNRKVFMPEKERTIKVGVNILVMILFMLNSFMLNDCRL